MVDPDASGPEVTARPACYVSASGGERHPTLHPAQLCVRRSGSTSTFAVDQRDHDDSTDESVRASALADYAAQVLTAETLPFVPTGATLRRWDSDMRHSVGTKGTSRVGTSLASLGQPTGGPKTS